MTQTAPPTRRALLGAAAATALAPISARAATQDGSDAFAYEVQRSVPDWLTRLTDEEFRVMRLGGTEVPHSSKTWDERRAGMFLCKGCDLPIYDSRHKVHLTKGWAFFQHSCRDSVLMGIDGEETMTMGGQPQAGYVAGPTIEAHCRRCGSHLGHILWVERQILHCINGIALTFAPADA